MKRSVLRSWWSSSSCWPAICHAPPGGPLAVHCRRVRAAAGLYNAVSVSLTAFRTEGGTWTSCARHAAMGLDLASRRDACFGRSPQRNQIWGTRQCSRRGCCCSCEQADVCPASLHSACLHVLCPVMLLIRRRIALKRLKSTRKYLSIRCYIINGPACENSPSKRVPAPAGQLLGWHPVAPDSSIARCCGSRGEKEPD